MADVKVILDDLIEDSRNGSVSATAASRYSFKRWAGIIAVLVFLVGLAEVWLMQRHSRTPPAGGLSALPLTGNQGLEGQPAFSPDGNQVAYSWSGIKEDNFDIYVKLIGPGAPLRLTTDPAPDILPAWSPDGRWVAFLRQRSDELFEIMLIPALGGTQRKIGEAFMRIGGHPVWTPDNQYLIVAGRPTPQEPNGLSTISISTGEMRILTVPPFAAIGGDGQPTLSPDGRMLAFIRVRAVPVWIFLPCHSQRMGNL